MNHNPHRLTRRDLMGSARIRLNFTPEEADLIEQRARESGLTVMQWIYSVLLD